MAVGDEQLVDEVFVLDRGRHLAAAAAALGLVVRHRLGFRIAGMRQRHHEILPLDEVLDGHVRLVGDDLRAALVAIGGLHRGEFLADDLQQPFRAREDVAKVPDLVQQFGEFRDDLVLLEAGQAMQAQVEDGLGLLLRQPVFPVVQAEIIRDPFRARQIPRPRARASAARRRRTRRATAAPPSLPAATARP